MCLRATNQPSEAPPQSSEARPAWRGAFTLIEALVALTIIAILAGILATASGGAKERSRRTACAGNVRQFLFAVHLYASENNDILPRGGGEMNLEMHTSLLPRQTLTNLVRYVKSLRVLDCPNLNPRFEKKIPGMYLPDWRTHGEGIVVGFHYLGGHTGTPWPPFSQSEVGTNRWLSPQRSSDNPTAPIIADLNTYGGGMTLAPHCNRGSVIFERHANAVPPLPLRSARSAGAAGGNVAMLGGSVEWKGIAAMGTYPAAKFGDYYGNW